MYAAIAKKNSKKDEYIATKLKSTQIDLTDNSYEH
jgi:hypothetical protein